MSTIAAPVAAAPALSATPPPLPAVDVTSSVELVAWPSAAHRRDQLRSLGRPRVLVLAEGAGPPLVWDDLEDWVRADAGPEEVAARCERVRAAAEARRAEHPAPLVVDADGSVRLGARTAQVAPAAAPLLAALAQHLDRPVARRVLVDLVADGLLPGGLDSLVGPLRRAVRPLGIGIESAGPDALVLFLTEPTEGAR